MGTIHPACRKDISEGMVTMELYTDAVTYDLRVDPAWTVSLRALADEFIVEGVRYTMPFLRAYYSWNSAFGRGPANVETMLEALTFGILWNLYSGALRESEIDGDRTGSHESINAMSDGELLPAIGHFMLGLRRKGELEEETRRMERLTAFFSASAPAEIRRHLTAIARFAGWFTDRARELLGTVTGQVDDFRTEAAISDQYRTDAALRERHEVEYHLNLLSAVVLNGAWSVRFFETRKKLLILPGCMRPDGGRNCRARETELGRICADCTGNCPANRARKAADRHGISTVILEHQSTVFSARQAQAIRDHDYAVIGVACVLSLQAGGWKAQNAGIPAQCIPLAYAGCARHWTGDRDIATQIDTGFLDLIADGANIVSGW